VQTALDVGGCFPVVGEACDLVNAGISLARRDYLGAGLSLLSVIPVYGDAVGKGGKLARRATKYADEAAAAVRGASNARGVRFATKYGEYVRRADNFKHALSREHVLAALAEKQGKTVKLKRDGTPFDHLQETRNAMHGAKMRINALKKYLTDPALTSEQRRIIEGELGELSQLLDGAERILGELAR
jgi:hypothetical protein